MAALFLESSALIKRYVREIGSDWVIEQTTPGPDRSLFVASITKVEVISALTRSSKQGGALSLEDARHAIAYFRSDLAHGLLSPGDRYCSPTACPVFGYGKTIHSGGIASASQT